MTPKRSRWHRFKEWLGFRTCRICHVTKRLNQFVKHKESLGGYEKQCRECRTYRRQIQRQTKREIKYRNKLAETREYLKNIIIGWE